MSILSTLFQRQPPPDLDALLAAASERGAARALAEVRDARAATEQLSELVRAQQTGMAGMPTIATPGQSPGVYARDHPWWHQSYYGPTHRPGQIVSFEMLDQFSRMYDILRAMINHLKNEVEQIPLQIVSKDDSDKSAATKKRIATVRDWFDEEGVIGGEGETRSEFEKKLVEDLHVAGAGTVYFKQSRGGDILQALAIDSSTIRPRVDIYGWPGPGEDWYEQYIDGIRQRGFTRDEIYWKGLYPRTKSPFPDIPVEYLVLTVLTALKADEWNRVWLTEGWEPDKTIPVPADWTPDQMMKYSEYIKSCLSGNLADRRNPLLVAAGMGGAQTNSRRDHDFDTFMQWLAHRASAIIGVQLASIGWVGEQYKVAQEGAMDATSDTGVTKLLTFLTALYNYILRRKGYRDLEVKFVTAREEKAQDRADRVTKLVAGGVYTPNEARIEEGKDSMEGGDVLFISTTLQPLDLALNPPEPTLPGTAPGTESSGDKAAGGQGDGDIPWRLARAEDQGGSWVMIHGHPVFISSAEQNSSKGKSPSGDDGVHVILGTSDGKTLGHLPTKEETHRVVAAMHEAVNHYAAYGISQGQKLTDGVRGTTGAFGGKLRILDDPGDTLHGQNLGVSEIRINAAHSGEMDKHYTEAAKDYAAESWPSFAQTSTADTIVHELAHSLYNALPKKRQGEWQKAHEGVAKAGDRWKEFPSAYGIENELESWAESVTAIVTNKPNFEGELRDKAESLLKTFTSGDKKATQQRAALGLWQRKALRRLKERGNAEARFGHEAIPVEMTQRIWGDLQECDTSEQVRSVFAAAVESLEDLFPPVYHTSAQGHERQQIGAKWAARRVAAEREA